MSQQIELAIERAEIIYEALSDLIEGHFGGEYPLKPEYLTTLQFSFAVIQRKLSLYIKAFSQTADSLMIDASSIEATLEDIVGVFGINIPGPCHLLKVEKELIEELNFKLNQTDSPSL